MWTSVWCAVTRSASSSTLYAANWKVTLVRPMRDDARVHLELVVEPSGREVLDVVRAHHEVAAAPVVQEPEAAEVLDAREVEVRVVAAVVDDSLGIGVREPDPRAAR